MRSGARYTARMPHIAKLSDIIAEFPGIGPRQARRVVQFLLLKPQSFRKDLAAAIEKIGSLARECVECHRFDELQSRGLCSVCSDTKRDAVLMVVEHDVDIDAVESSSAYHGKYFVLGWLIPMAKQRKKERAPRVKELVERIKSDGIKEVILALSTTPEGDYTARELRTKLSTISRELSVSMLGRGLSVGAEIEYADAETLRNALKNRGL
jgi:recombination protein RecR